MMKSIAYFKTGVFRIDGKKRWAIQFCLIFMVGLLFCLWRGRYANFQPLNGTFQNYNPVRRFISGQKPYEDFQDYLGLGHLYFGTFFTLVFGGNYLGSLTAFNYLTFLGCIGILLTIGHFILGKDNSIYFVSGLLLFHIIGLCIQRVNPFSNSTFSFFYVGNSARIIRGMIAPISVWLLYSGRHVLFNRSKFRFVLIPFVCAFCFLWSNDYGISSWLCIQIFLFFLQLIRGERLLKAIFCSFLTALLSVFFIFLLVQILTFGNFTGWLSSTFGNGGFQSWYYNGSKSFHIYNINFEFPFLFQGCLVLCYLIVLWIRRSENNNDNLLRFAVPCYLNMVSFCAVNEYKLLSGGSLNEVATLTLSVTLCAEIYSFIKAYLIEDGVKIISSFFCIIKKSCTYLYILIVVLQVCLFAVFAFGKKDGVFISSLGGYNTEFADDLLNASHFIEGRSFFSTYSSAQEVIEGQFQPSGTDYIIHVLGDNQRKKYLDCFKMKNFDLAVTLNECFTNWEYWLPRANWFFYRELYDSWHPVFANSYEIYWEPNEEGFSNTIVEQCSVKVEEITPSEKKIVVVAESEVSGVADLYLIYSTKNNGSLKSKFIFNSMVRIRNSGVGLCGSPEFESNWLRDTSAEFIPVQIIDGYGEILVSSEPNKQTILTIDDAKCNRIIKTPFLYVHVIGAYEDSNGLCFVVEKSNRNMRILEKARRITLNQNEYNIRRINVGENILVYVDGVFSPFMTELDYSKNMAYCN